jgi:hypothetical protein
MPFSLGRLPMSAVVLRRVLLSALLGLDPAAGMAQVPSVPGCPRGRADGRAIEIRTTVGLTATALVPLVDSVLVVNGYQIDTGLSGPLSRVTIPSLAWPRGTETETWHGQDHPGVRLFVTLAGRGDSTTVTIGAHVICLLGSPEDDARPSSVSGMLRMIAAMQVAAGLAERLRAP